MKNEEKIYLQLSEYMSFQHPKALFKFDTGSGARVTIGTARINKRINPYNGYPDLFIAEPRGLYHGLFIEIKTSTPFKKDGFTLLSTGKRNHLENQANVLKMLRHKGYFARFGVGFDECVAIIDNYLKIK